MMHIFQQTGAPATGHSFRRLDFLAAVQHVMKLLQ
jgi:hypothetical protein